MSGFKKATRSKLKGRIAMDGVSGGGKTYTALRAAFTLGQKVAVIDTENRSASKYVGVVEDGNRWEFDVCELSEFSPPAYTKAIHEAEELGYDVIVIDSLSHAWVGEGGVLDMKDRKQGFDAWKDITPLQRRMVDAIIRSKCHVIATMRTKTEYVIEEQTNKQGKVVKVPRKIGMAPVQKDGLEYEFDLYFSMDDSVATVSKSRCPDFVKGSVELKPGKDFFGKFKKWLEEGSEVVRITPQSRELLAQLKAELNINDLAFGRRLAELYRVKSIDDLTQSDAADLIAKLEAKRPAAAPQPEETETADEAAA